MTHDTSALFAALGRLDARLSEAVSKSQALADALADTDPYRGLHISAAEVRRLLQAEPGAPPPWGDRSGALVGRGAATPFDALARDAGLGPLDLDILLIALAPDIDLRYERIYAYLQDDATRRHASIDLILNLLGNDVPSRLAARARFGADAPLRRHRLLHLQADPNAPQASFLAQAVKVDAQLLRRLLGERGVDPQLISCCRIVQPQRTLAELPLPEPTRRALARLAERCRAGGSPLRLAFHGRRGAGKSDAAEAVAGSIGVPMLALDLEQAGAEPDVGPVRAVELALRDAATMGALLHVGGLHALPAEQGPRVGRAITGAGPLDRPIATVLSGRDADGIAALRLADFIDVAFEMPDVAERLYCWHAHLAGSVAADADLDLLAQRFRLGPGQIAAAARLAQQRSLWKQAAAAPAGPLDAVAPGADELAAAARAQTGHELARLARKVTIRQGWDDLVLPDDQRTQLEEICLQFTRRHVVHGDWGFGRKLSLGKGLNCLFSGPPGTGKTMAAEVIAHALQLDLYKIDLSQVVSKYIGETEKNLDRVFGAAEDANAILFFDEADALFGKRSEAKDAHDRYANIEVGYLLQKMEEYAGVAILATNLKSHLDDAFLRRLHVVVEFPLPDEDHRRRIWQGVFPREAPVGADVDFALLARAVRMSGGNIRNIGLASAFYAAGDGGVIHMPHIVRAVRREHQKLGRSWTDWSQA